MNNALTYLDMNFEGRQIKAAQMAVDTSLNGRTLDVDTMTATVESQTALVPFQQNTPVRFLRGGSQYALWYLSEIRRIAGDLYSLSMTSSLGRLTQMEHRGGIYNGVAASVIIDDICGVVPHFVGAAFRDVLLYGWLPYVAPSGENGARTGSAKDNLLQVLFALNATVRDDANGVLRIENLSTEISSRLDANRIYQGNARVVTEPPITGVTVLEHQYLQGSDSVTLFDGTTTAGQIIVFQAPMSNVTASGFSIIEPDANANYAVVASAGSGTLTGTPYVHTTREVTTAISHRYDLYKPQYTGLGPILGATLYLEAGTTYLIESEDFGTFHFVATKDLEADTNNTELRLTYIDGVLQSATITFFPAPQTTGWTAMQYSVSEGEDGEPLLSGQYVWNLSDAQNVAIPNAVRIEEATLVSAANSPYVVKRLVDYYKHRTYINIDAVVEFEDAGDVVAVYDPFDKVMKQACIERISPLVVSSTMKGTISALLDYTPRQESAFQYVREMITGSGLWPPSGVTIPNGTQVDLVLISGASGGDPGDDGEAAATGAFTPGGKGGKGGAGGKGGRILRASFTYTTGATFPYQCGSGGAPGADGSDTVFGSFSTETGASDDGGYYDIQTGETFALPGEFGVSGADGGRRVSSGESLTHDGATYNGGAPGNSIPGYFTGQCYGGSGGGAAVGGNGLPGGDGITEYNQGHGWNQGGNGGDGGSAIDRAEVPTIYGTGGYGGHGGGGGGGSGSATGADSYTQDWAFGGRGGAGGKGGVGAAGCIIARYRLPSD